MAAPKEYLASRELPPAQEPRNSCADPENHTDSNTKIVRLFYSGTGKGLKSNVSKDAINAEQRELLVQIPWSHDREGKNTITEFTTANRRIKLIPMLGNFYVLK